MHVATDIAGEDQVTSLPDATIAPFGRPLYLAGAEAAYAAGAAHSIEGGNTAQWRR